MIDLQRKAWRRAERHAQLPLGKIALGVQYMSAAGAWVVFCSLYGSDVSPLTGWPNEERALIAFDRYRAACGVTNLLHVVLADESDPDYIDARHPFTAAELREIAAALAVTR
jgi:hypothetical protein